MNEFTDTIRSSLDSWGQLVEVVLNYISLLCIITGVVISVIRSVRERQRMPGEHPMHTYFRKTFGGWLVVALEVQLAADIVGTIISPSSSHLIELGAIAVIRTFLNYFLSKELKEEVELSRVRVVKKE